MTLHVTTDRIFPHLASAPVYAKRATVTAVRVTSPEDVETVLVSGFVETTNRARLGSWIVTNPGGERYVVDDDVFRSRYAHAGGDRWEATRRVRAVPNPFGDAVTIDAPWGPQDGDRHCWIAVRVEAPDEPYLIGGAEFADTYEREA